MLEVSNLSARYGQAQVVREVTFSVAPGEAVALVGANGAGKTTALRAIGGLHQVRTGTVRLDGEDLSRASTVATARAGLVLVPQGRRLFGSLTVSEHVRLAESRRSDVKDRLTSEEVFGFFPQLAQRLSVRAGSLSGGEQQMLAITRAVLQGPRYILLDEPTEGLSPSMVAVVAGLVTQLPARGMGLVITEQSSTSHVLATATRHLTMDRGRVTAASGESLTPEAEAAPVTGDGSLDQGRADVHIERPTGFSFAFRRGAAT
jgi:branched-chain amino acid transport system ATP-binding protein